MERPKDMNSRLWGVFYFNDMSSCTSAVHVK